MKMVGQSGIDTLSIEAVAANAGLSKGGVFHHFPSKKNLLEEMFKECLAQFTKSFERERSASHGISPAIAYLKATLADLETEAHRRTMLFLFQASTKEGYYRTYLDDWHKTHLQVDLTNEQNVGPLLAVLVADGLWNAGLYGFFEISEKQKKQIAHLVETLQQDQS